MTDRVALITGSTSGIGRATAHTFGSDGFGVIGHGLTDEEIGGSSAEIRSLGGAASFLAGDLRDPGFCEDLVAHAINTFGRVDVLVNNAGANIFAGTLQAEISDWESCLDLDLRASWLLSKAAARHMARESAIVNISSNHAFGTLPGAFPYNIAKVGVLGLTQSLALELAPRGIRVNAVCPGYIDTPINDKYFATFPEPAEERARVQALHPLGRLGSPRDVARAVSFLASEEAAGFITGTHLVLDGGRGTLLQDPSGRDTVAGRSELRGE